MLIINGVNLFPIQIEKILMAVPEIGRNYLIEVRKENYMDRLEVKVELNEEVFRGTCRSWRSSRPASPRSCARSWESRPGEAGGASSLPVSEGKAKRVYDLRGGEA